MTYRLARASIATATLVASAQAADAHIVASRLGDFYTGALHPLTDLQDLILWVAMGVLAGSLGASKGRWLVLAFPLGLLAGLVLGRTTGFVSAGPAADAGMILVLGLLLAAAPRIPTALLCVIAFGLAVMRGAACHARILDVAASLADLQLVLEDAAQNRVHVGLAERRTGREDYSGGPLCLPFPAEPTPAGYGQPAVGTRSAFAESTPYVPFAHAV
jgi:hydrogenase/urease accessory protein HupE